MIDPSQNGNRDQSRNQNKHNQLLVSTIDLAIKRSSFDANRQIILKQ
jgi:hypothetical protein